MNILKVTRKIIFSFIFLIVVSAIILYLASGTLSAIATKVKAGTGATYESEIINSGKSQYNFNHNQTCWVSGNWALEGGIYDNKKKTMAIAIFEGPLSQPSNYTSDSGKEGKIYFCSFGGVIYDDEHKIRINRI